MLGETVVLPAKASDYGEKLMTNPVENYPEYRKWIDKALKNPVGCSVMLGDNRKRFRAMFGKPSFVYTGEFRYDCWLVGIGTGSVLVLTAKGKGTCYEVPTEWNGERLEKNVKKVLEFMEMVGELD